MNNVYSAPKEKCNCPQSLHLEAQLDNVLLKACTQFFEIQELKRVNEGLIRELRVKDKEITDLKNVGRK